MSLLQCAIATVMAGCSLLYGMEVAAQVGQEKPSELELLGQYTGDWTSDVTSKPAVWTPREVRYRTENHAEFVLDGWFLQHIERNRIVDDPERVGKSIWFSTYDRRLEKFVTWYFQSSGLMGRSQGDWDPQQHMFYFHDDDPPPGTTNVFTEEFNDSGDIEGRLAFVGSDTRIMFAMEWTRTRARDRETKDLRENWSETGSPIEPLPPEIERFEGNIGKWDVEFTNRPSELSPAGRTSSGTMTAQWILDGRFLMGQTQLGTYSSIWVMGYDTNRKAYRSVRMGSDGAIEESRGEWDDAHKVFKWQIVNGDPGITRTWETQRIDENTIETEILAKRADGTIHQDLTIHARRRE